MKLSICIPAYKRVDYLKKLLDSIAIQTFRDFEVIVTDDSNDSSVGELIEQYHSSIPNLKYFKNETTKGTPENWNEAIRNANSEWIKLMHDDDWFSSENSLEIFAESIDIHPDKTFLFCAYNNVLDNKIHEEVKLSSLNRLLLKRSPYYLFKKQFIGNPSCTLIRKQSGLLYDNHLKWVVDFEFYIRYLLQFPSFYYIDKALINVGLNEDQVTKYTFRNPEVELPENHFLLRNFGTKILRNIFAYDYYWRMYRNLKIRKVEDILPFDKKPLLPAVKKLVAFQGKVSHTLLSIGIFSKFFMLISYLTNLRK